MTIEARYGFSKGPTFVLEKKDGDVMSVLEDGQKRVLRVVNSNIVTTEHPQTEYYPSFEKHRYWQEGINEAELTDKITIKGIKIPGLRKSVGWTQGSNPAPQNFRRPGIFIPF